MFIRNSNLLFKNKNYMHLLKSLEMLFLLSIIVKHAVCLTQINPSFNFYYLNYESAIDEKSDLKTLQVYFVAMIPGKGKEIYRFLKNLKKNNFDDYFREASLKINTVLQKIMKNKQNLQNYENFYFNLMKKFCSSKPSDHIETYAYNNNFIEIFIISYIKYAENFILRDNEKKYIEYCMKIFNLKNENSIQYNMDKLNFIKSKELKTLKLSSITSASDIKSIQIFISYLYIEKVICKYIQDYGNFLDEVYETLVEINNFIEDICSNDKHIIFILFDTCIENIYRIGPYIYTDISRECFIRFHDKIKKIYEQKDKQQKKQDLKIIFRLKEEDFSIIINSIITNIEKIKHKNKIHMHKKDMEEAEKLQLMKSSQFLIDDLNKLEKEVKDRIEDQKITGNNKSVTTEKDDSSKTKNVESKNFDCKIKNEPYNQQKNTIKKTMSNEKSKKIYIFLTEKNIKQINKEEDYNYNADENNKNNHKNDFEHENINHTFNITNKLKAKHIIEINSQNLSKNKTMKKDNINIENDDEKNVKLDFDNKNCDIVDTQIFTKESDGKNNLRNEDNLKNCEKRENIKEDI